MIKTIKFILYATYAVIVLVVMGAITTSLMFYVYSRDLPDYKQLRDYNPPGISRLYDADGNLIAEYAKEYRIFLPIDKIPIQLINAFIAAEDKSFFENPGIDLSSITKAMMKNAYKVLNKKQQMLGGSTITQQVVKNFLLSNEKTIKRKIKEAILAYRITSYLNKEKILELYLNHIYLGNRSYGITAAALRYFNKMPEELTIDQIAVLAALPKAPSKINPIKNPDATIARRNWVLQRMYEDGYIDEIAKKIFQSEPLQIVTANDKFLENRNSFIDEVHRKISKEYGESALYKDGLTVYTTFSPYYQELAKNSLRKGIELYDKRHGWRGPIKNIADQLEENKNYDWKNFLKKIRPSINMSSNPWNVALVLNVTDDAAQIGVDNGLEGKIILNDVKWAKELITNNKTGPVPKKVTEVLSVGDVILVSNIKNTNKYALQQVPLVNGAIVVMEPSTGRVLAMVGGYDYSTSQFNRATQAFRQPGSVFKTFVYLAAMEQGLMLNSIVLDDHLTIDQGNDLPLWQPRNMGNTFLGPITLRSGFEQSRNLVTIRIARFLGMKNITKVSKKLGIYTSALTNYATTLGSEVITLLRMTKAYAIIANGGHSINCHLVDRIQDKEGNNKYLANYIQCPRCNIETDAPDFKMLTPLPPQTTTNSRQLIDPIHAYQTISLLEGTTKNGTSRNVYMKNQYIAGKTGTTSNNVDAWFIGFTNNLVVGVYVGFDNPENLGNNETGSRLASPIFKEFMKTALKDNPSQPFKIPIGLNVVEIDRATGVPINNIVEPDVKQIIREALPIGNENKIISLIERKHYYDPTINKWMVALEENDDIENIIDNLDEHYSKQSTETLQTEEHDINLLLEKTEQTNENKTTSQEGVEENQNDKTEQFNEEKAPQENIKGVEENQNNEIKQIDVDKEIPQKNIDEEQNKKTIENKDAQDDIQGIIEDIVKTKHQDKDNNEIYGAQN